MQRLRIMAGAALLAPGAPALAQDPGPDTVATVSAEYVIDWAGIAHGPDTGVVRTDLIDVAAVLSLERLVGWHGGLAVFEVLAGTGKRPNDHAGTQQGINNIEVPRNRVRLFQAYVEQELPAVRGSLRLGFSDLNSEFYANDAAGLLIAPAFGIGSELSATGPNGPSIFPSSAPMARLRLAGRSGTYAQAAFVNAEAGVPGDAGGVRPLLRKGALVIAEAGWTGKGKLALGAWNYTRRQDDIRDTTPIGTPQGRRARGLYLLAETPVVRDRITAFLRAGTSDGDTTPYAGGWQTGLLATGIVPGRPEGQFSIGANQAFLSRKFRDNAADAGAPLRHAETALEATYADSLTPWLSIQPDAMYVWSASRAPGSRDALVLTLRLRASFSHP